MMLEFFLFQHTLNRSFNSCINLYWYWIRDCSWNMKDWASNWPPLSLPSREKNTLQKHNLIRVKKQYVACESMFVQRKPHCKYSINIAYLESKWRKFKNQIDSCFFFRKEKWEKKVIERIKQTCKRLEIFEAKRE